MLQLELILIVPVIRTFSFDNIVLDIIKKGPTQMIREAVSKLLSK